MDAQGPRGTHRSQWDSRSTQAGASKDPGRLRAPPTERSSGRSGSEAGPVGEPAGTSCCRRGAWPGPHHAPPGAGPGHLLPLRSCRLRLKLAVWSESALPSEPSDLGRRAESRAYSAPRPKSDLRLRSRGRAWGHLFFPEPEGRPHRGTDPSPLHGQPRGLRVRGWAPSHA